MSTMQIVRGWRLALIALLVGIVAVAWWSPLDDLATKNVDDGFKRALVSFGTARALNAAISLIQSTTFSATPLGIGVSVAPGQILRPLNELIAQFAELMLAASIAFGVIKIMIGIGSFWVVSALLSAVAIIWVALLWRHGRLPYFLTRLLIGMLFLRFAIPVIFVVTSSISTHFLAAEYSTSQNALENKSTLLERDTPSSNSVSSNGVRGLWENIKDVLGSDSSKRGADARVEVSKLPIVDGSNIESRLAKLKSFAAEMTEHIVKIIVVFLLQTLVIPLLLLILLSKFLRTLALTRRQPV